MIARLRAPAAHGSILSQPPFGEVAAMALGNRSRLNASTIRLGGVPIAELRKQLRAEIGLDSARPLIVTGHQPEPFHPGVLIKNFAASHLAKSVDGTGLHLVADHDAMKSAAIRMPIWAQWKPGDIREESIPFDDAAPEQPWETRPVLSPDRWNGFIDDIRTKSRNWGYVPLLLSIGDRLPETGTWSERLSALRRSVECDWGCCNAERTVSALAGTETFRHFVRTVNAELPAVRSAYNAAVQQYRKVHRLKSLTHPVPELAEGESPFWELTATGRVPATPQSSIDAVRPRAITLTWFVRLLLADHFIHGLGGGKYDAATDDIMLSLHGLEPPPYQVLTATMHLPLPHFEATIDDLHREERHRRDLDWQPERFVRRHPLAIEKQTLLTQRPEPIAARRAWFQRIHSATKRLRDELALPIAMAEREAERYRCELRANRILANRDYAWWLHPAEALRELMARAIPLP